METLFQARRSMQHSYSFAFYLFDSTNTNSKLTEGCKKFSEKELKIAQTLFEDTQQELENSTEKLSGLLELPADKLAWDEQVKKDVISTTVLVDKRLQALFDIIQQEFMNEDSFLPKPKSVISSGSRMRSAMPSGGSIIKQSAAAVPKSKKGNNEDPELQYALQLSMLDK